MVYDSRKKVATGTIPSPTDFRGQATGVGQTTLASRRTGIARAQAVADSCDPSCARLLPDSYPARTPEFCPPDPNGGAERSSSRIYDLSTKTHPGR